MTDTATTTALEGQQWLERLLQLMDLNTRVLSQALAENHNWLEIDSQMLGPEASQALLGKDGIILDSLQFLVNTHLNLDTNIPECAYTVELLGYRAQRHKELLALAEQAIQAVRATGKEYVFEPLRSAERRQLHMMLSGEQELFTFSRGKEPDRYLVLSPKADPDKGSEDSDEAP
ncbi:R3H domain-containing nucleic acid-binding protein [Candidatus Cyanaurora vandensis]|uniref:Jag family protein n=1 Tax=Candidatus Cyanaurora vandensis TaxID=2714958 RepID=UPI0025797FE4|nr:R3H domain-containing nucleic acid-binding protein [Candidatus Cyanaurora vandensis]